MIFEALFDFYLLDFNNKEHYTILHLSINLVIAPVYQVPLSKLIRFGFLIKRREFLKKKHQFFLNIDLNNY
jgi:hypothetical protein